MFQKLRDAVKTSPELHHGNLNTAHHLNIILKAMLLSSALMLVVFLIMEGVGTMASFGFTVSVTVGFIVSGLGLLLLSRRGATRLSAGLLLVLLWAVLTIMALQVNGMFDVVVMAYFLLLGAGGLLLGRRGVLGTGLLNLLGMVLLLVFQPEPRTLILTAPSQVMLQFLTVVIILGLTGLVFYLVINDWYKAAAAHREAAQTNAALNRELENYSGYLEQAVEERTADLEKTTERVETILHHSPDAILLLDQDGDIERANPAFHALFGYEDEEVPALTMSDLVSDDMQQSLERMLRHTREQITTRRLVVVARPRDGKTFDAEIALAPVTEDSTLLGVVCIIRDISALKDLERLKDQFLSTAAHELRTPLVTVQGFSEILLTRDLTAERQRRYLTMINQQATELAQIIDDLLDVSRLEAGRELDIKSEPVDINQLVEDALEPFQETAPDHRIDYHPLDEDLRLYADPFRLTQVIRNLLNNAVKYSPDGGVVTVRSQTLPDYLLVSVQDEGIGMTPDEMGHLFEAFWRADAAEKVAGGTGLGLRICRLIIAGHSGGIWAESQPGEGTTLYFTLPLDDSKKPKEK